MIATLIWLLQTAGLSAPADTLRPATPAAADSARVAPADTAARKVVRQFPAVEVHGALLYDLRSSQTVHEIAPAALRDYPADRLAELVALKPGVVVLGDELHVRGGRTGQTLVSLGGVSLNEPLRHRPMELPLLAVRGAELVSGTPETRHAGSIAGVLDVRTVDPGEHVSGEARWQTDGGLDTRYDRVSGRVSVPVAPLGLGVVLAGDALLDDTSYPALRSAGRQEIAGFTFGWRAENRMLGYLKLAPIHSPGRFSAQVLGGRMVHRPFDPAWSLDGWSGFDGFGLPVFSVDSVPGYDRYRAADHQSMTDERRVATVLSAAGSRGGHRGSLTLGWLYTRTATTVGGGWTIPESPENPAFGDDVRNDPFHVIRGDDPLYRVSGSDVITFRADADLATKAFAPLRVGLGGTWERVEMDELDATLLSSASLDAWRRFSATAPGVFAYGQGRWQSGGLVVNAGLRAEGFSAGPEGDDQTLPGSTGLRWSLLPRLGLAYPLSSRDVFTMAYARVDEAPARDLLYDHRTRITNRQPLGNPALRPATMISYEAALKRLFSATWALQGAFFYRDVAHLAGARDYRTPGGPVDQRYTDEDQASAGGLEVSLLHVASATRRIEAHYTIMHAWGYESRPEGDPYGPVLAPGTPPFAERPLSWDRRHSVLVSGLWQWGERVTLAGSYRVGSPLPWTPKNRREPLADLTQVNSRRFGWSQIVHLGLSVAPPYALGLTLGVEARNLLNDRSEYVATVDGFPNPVINTAYDDYGAYRTETGLPGGAYWTTMGGAGHWASVNDPRLLVTPRTLRASIAKRW